MKKIKEVVVWTLGSFIASAVASLFLPIIGGLVSNAILGTAVCFKREPSLLVVILTWIGAVVGASIIVYAYMGYNFYPSIIYLAITNTFIFWITYYRALKYPATS